MIAACKRSAQAAVVNRDMVAVVTRGTMADAEMVSGHPEASFMLALCEATPPPPSQLPSAVQANLRYSGDEQTRIAACAVDVSSGHLLMGEWWALLPALLPWTNSTRITTSAVALPGREAP